MNIYRRLYVLGSKIKIKSIEQVTTLFNRMVFLFSRQPLVKTTDESLSLIVQSKCSISRYGDGEFNLMYGTSLRFQPYSQELSLRLREIIKSDQENHKVFIPNIFNNVDWCTERSRNYWIRYLNLNRFKIYKLLSKSKVYYDSLVTRLYIDYKDKSQAGFRFKTFKKLWNQKDIIIIEGEQSRLGIGNNLFDNAKSIKRILCPAIDAFAKYDQILKEVKKHDKSKLVLIALGPTATVLAYDLANIGYHAVDIGHIDVEYEWFLNKAIEKEAIKNKYVGEVPDGTDVHGISNIKYEEEIITRIS
ncbi:SP_1767 family glycosyltransferase [Bacillus sp. AFS017336]|uniref:SP_1767 family glycosyltransferase n=1 Tax=Bacillus sp. AFS017336 TaxID=2033489 RepID=UPI000BF0F9BA|nr:SP_1767 family glycosyltransferase [Bacillus sp. AFS017336]PEL07025.1 glycosyl transferase family 8 [Bacillus sp. AFS017336]